MSLATFAMAAASAIQAVLYLGRFGTNARTDGFFVAFALYSTFGVFSQSLRLTSVGLLVEPGARLSTRRFAAVLGAIAVPVLVLTVPLAGSLAEVIAPGLKAGGREVTATALPVLGVAMVLQLWAAGGATVLAIRGRFGAIAGAYMAGAGAGLVAFLALMDRAGVQTLGWSMAMMSVLTCAWMLIGVQRSGGLGPWPTELAARPVEPWAWSLRLGNRPPGPGLSRLFGSATRGAFRSATQGDFDSTLGGFGSATRDDRAAPGSLLRDCAAVLGRTSIYLAFNLLFVVTLAFASRTAAGGTTVLSYAYLFASYLVAGTGMALGMSSIPDLTRQARAQRRALVASTVPRGFRYAMLLVAPALAGLIAAGAPLIHALLPRSLSLAEVHTLRVFALLLVPWTVAALLVNFLLPVLLAMGRTRLLGTLAPALLALHFALTAAGAALWGVDGAVGVFWVAPAALAAVLLLSGAGTAQARELAGELGADGARFLALAALAFGVGWVGGSVLGADLAQAAVAGVLGCAAYMAGLCVVARRQLRVLVSTVVARPASA
jgi:peptidoglycan biosynthesis protein MviN/MurJ (putative lipid II flippase)